MNQADRSEASVWAVAVMAGSLLTGGALAYGYFIDPALEARDRAIEQKGFDRGVAYAGRKCWYRGYFMDGTQRYNCSAGEETKP